MMGIALEFAGDVIAVICWRKLRSTMVAPLCLSGDAMAVISRRERGSTIEIGLCLVRDAATVTCCRALGSTTGITLDLAGRGKTNALSMASTLAMVVKADGGP